MKKIKLSGFVLSALLFVASCKKEKNEEVFVDPLSLTEDVNMFILNEGGFGANNASLSTKSNGTDVSNNRFEQVNSKFLGALANDLSSYLGNTYVVLNGSEKIEVINELTLESVSTIEMTGKSPRNITFYNDYGFVSNFDGTVTVFNVNDFSIVKDINVGNNPEGLAVLGDKLYVANSGGLGDKEGVSDFDSTLSVIDLNTLTEIEKVVVSINLKKVFAHNNSLYITSADAYETTGYSILAPASLYQYIPSTGVVNTLVSDCQDFMIDNNNQALLYDGTEIKWFSLVDNEISATAYSLSEVTSFYGFGQLESSYYITDAGDFTGNGKVHFYNSEWSSLGNIEVGVGPKEILYTK
jgi:hypothetical protein